MTKKVALPICFIALILFIFLYLNFVRDIGAYREEEGKADAIVVLAGGLGRIDKGLGLFTRKKADYLIIAGVDKEASLESIFFKKGITLDAKRIILEKGSSSTYENALEIKKIVETKNIKSIILVTSFYHLKRASFTFSRILPSDVRLHLYPVATPNFDETAWWKGRGSILLSVEFVKFYWYRLWL